MQWRDVTARRCSTSRELEVIMYTSEDLMSIEKVYYDFEADTFWLEKEKLNDITGFVVCMKVL